MGYRNPNSFTRFADLVASGEKDIAKSNLFSVEITLPPMLYAKGGILTIESTMRQSTTSLIV